MCLFRKEISQYKELDPVGRLLLLRALCELRGIVIISLPFTLCTSDDLGMLLDGNFIEICIVFLLCDSELWTLDIK